MAWVVLTPTLVTKSVDIKANTAEVIAHSAVTEVDTAEVEMEVEAVLVETVAELVVETEAHIN